VGEGGFFVWHILIIIITLDEECRILKIIYKALTYNFYQRKDESISKNQLDWIHANIESISTKENVLFVFQAEHEVLLFTDSGIYFPNRPYIRRITYDEISTLKIAGDFYLELMINKSEIYTILFVDSIDKAKIFQIINLLRQNNKINKNSSFEDVQEIFEKFTCIKYPLNQMQHKIPQVYLKQFGYLENNQWKVSIIQKGEKFSRQKSIGSFTAETNIFDIESEDDRLPRIFESLNADLENLYPKILKDVSENDEVSDESWSILIQLAPNLMIRSDFWRDFVRDVINSDNKETFIDITFSIHTNSIDELRELKEQEFYKAIKKSELTNSIINRILLHFSNYVFHHLRSFNIIVLKAPEGKEFFTSDNPINFKANQLEGKLGLFSVDTEIYFPLSKHYLAYFYHSNSKKKSLLRQLDNRKIYNIDDIMNDEQYDELIKNEIVNNSNALLIVPFKMVYRF